ncbi:30S ribosomal protein S20 [uncultured Bifidobacterium sp.]|uniref:30S ribosomal protein S20 n=1 Tax=uncultured Bifidobacterium sp. TaxID=165187 RepID=UPI00262E2A85|nr:30S ribosomal protein S20 [uncultured Bifidobacterium sp.]
MANIKSQKKRVITNEKAHLRNKEVKSAIKTSVRSVRTAVDAGDREAAQAAYRVAARRLDQAAGKGVIHRNQAANRKSGLATAINAL